MVEVGGENLVGDACGCHFLLGGDFVYTSPNIGHIDSPSEDQALYIYLG
jgi:hypothetical protein